jgi:hypothetical protein
VNVGATGTVENSGNEEFISPEPGSADRTDPGPVAFKAVGAAFDVHKPVFAVE